MVKRYLKNQRGLTLIELLAVVVILGIIAAIAIPAIGGIIEKQKEKAQTSNALMLLDSAKMYYANHPDKDNDTTPLTFAILTGDKVLDAIPQDPFTGSAYLDDATHFKIIYHDGDPQITLVSSSASAPAAVQYNPAKTRSEILGTATN